MFVIETESVKLLLEVVPVATLCRHEEIVPEVARKLILEFANRAKLQNPIIVDEHHMVLDGHHRAYAFQSLNFTYIPVCKINYYDEAARLRYWFRLVDNMETLEPLREAVEEVGGFIEPVEDKECLDARMADNNLECGIQHGGFYGRICFPREVVHDAVSAYDVLETIQKRLLENRGKLTYIPCQSVHERAFCEDLTDRHLVIWTPRITKEMVAEAAEKQSLFPPKATRHLIPARPLNVNVPSRWFREDVSLVEINERFLRYLQQKEIRRFGPGQTIGGRYYEEELFVFSDKRPQEQAG